MIDNLDSTCSRRLCCLQMARKRSDGALSALQIGPVENLKGVLHQRIMKNATCSGSC
jgi:hypothetical protein